MAPNPSIFVARDGPGVQTSPRFLVALQRPRNRKGAAVCRQGANSAFPSRTHARNGVGMASTPSPTSPATPAERAPLAVLIAAPRGFCAGVDRAIMIVERSLEKFGAPVYVRHEIVHNRFVVDGLKAKGAQFVEELDEVPDGRPVVFSAHGVPKAVPANAQSRGLEYLDATCPLVSKVHRQAERQVDAGRHILFIGHANHPEVIGTFGQVPDGSMTLIQTEADAEAFTPAAGQQLAFLTQTTLSVDDTAAIATILQTRFPDIAAPKGEDICYATSNRQAATKAIASRAQAVLVIGAPNSSNSLRLVEVAERSGARARLIQTAAEIDFDWLGDIDTLGITAGASAPEVLVRGVIDALNTRFVVSEEEVRTTTEDIAFKLPRGLEQG